MRINNNLMAMNAHRQLGVVSNAGTKSMERLSSGFRINRAGDDAAGLAISEKMRGQIRGLTQASRNAQDGISLIQTAEGALQETHAILQRMRELAVQAATDTNTADDRLEIQKEMNELIDEIDRIAEQTQFNEQNLLDGSFTDKKFHIGANYDQDITLSISNMSSVTPAGGTTPTPSVSTSDPGVSNVNIKNDSTYASGDYTLTISYDSGASKTVATLTGPGSVNESVDITGADTYTIGDITFSIASDDIPGDEEDEDLVVNLTVTAADAGEAGEAGEGGLGIDGLKVENPESTPGGIMSQGGASEAITTIQNAIKTVSAERSKLGAYQNRLEHTIKNLETSAENLQASESRIRDVDMAKEIMEFTKNNIIQQAATAMLAQANQAPQGVLQLLR
jgi:flagellin